MKGSQDNGNAIETEREETRAGLGAWGLAYNEDDRLVLVQTTWYTILMILIGEQEWI